MSADSPTFAEPLGPGERPSLAASQAGWLFAWVIVGYPIFGMMAAFLDVESTVFSIPYRVLIVLYALVVLGLAIASRPLTPFPRLIAAFWLIYLVRLSWDLVVADVYHAGPAYIFFIVTGVIPALPLALLADRWDDLGAARKVLIVGALACGMGVAAELLGLASARSVMRAEEGRLSFEAVNPILFGHAGLCTLIAGLVWAKGSRTARARTWALLGAAVGALCLALAASRGPFVAAGVAAVAYFTVKRRWGVVFAVVVAAVVGFSLVPWLELGTATRFAGIDRDSSALGRLVLQQAALGDFWTHPLLGVAYLEPYYNDYPHNMIIESAMALGVGGLLLVLAILAKASWRMLRLIREDVLCLALIGIDALVGAQFSGALYGAVPVWATLVVILGMRRRRRAPAGEASPELDGPGEIAPRTSWSVNRPRAAS
jgi:O-antigen ligase